MNAGCHRLGPFAGCLLVVAATAASASPIEIPVNTTGSTGFVPLVYGAHTVNAALATSVESDGYTFSAVAGDRVRLVVSSATPALDPILQLRNPSGTVIGSATCSGRDNFGNPIVCATNLDSLLAAGGTYTINMADAGSNNAGAYTLHLDRYPGNGLTMPDGSSFRYDIGHLGDVDYYSFDSNAGTQFRISTASRTAGLDMRIQVWDPAGAAPRTVSCSGRDQFGNPILCGTLIDIAATVAGTYLVGIDDSGWNNTGGYDVAGNCTFGICQPVPEAPSAALLAAGIAALGWRLRRTRRD